MSSRTRKISMTVGQAYDHLIAQGVPGHWLSSTVQADYDSAYLQDMINEIESAE
jgi:hypothetical protein